MLAEGREQANGAQGRNRTTDTAIFSRMLYQLSYLGRSRDGRKWPSERAGYSGVEGCCPPAFAFGYGAAGPASRTTDGEPEFSTTY